MGVAKFFGYKHWTLEDPSRCFNVGKGLKGRAHSHKRRNHKWHAIVKRYGLRIEVCVGPVFNEEACTWEIEQIAVMQTFTINHSHDDQDDIGCNLTKGGEGTAGRFASDETREKIRKSKTGVSVPALSQALQGRFLSVDHRQQISAGMASSTRHQEANSSRSQKLKGRSAPNKGQTLSYDHRKAIGQSLLGNTNTLGKRYGHQRCGLCRQLGHKRSTCPERNS